MRCVTILVFLLSTAPSAMDASDEVASIDGLIEEISGMISDHILFTRRIEYTHPTIPGIGMPSNHITGYFLQCYDEEYSEPVLEEVPLLIVNTYFHAGYTAEESYYFSRNGEMLCCISTLHGECFDRDDFTDYFYYRSGNAIFYKDNAGYSTYLIEDEISDMAISRIQASITLRQLFDVNVPAPRIFWEKWGDWMSY